MNSRYSENLTLAAATGLLAILAVYGVFTDVVGFDKGEVGRVMLVPLLLAVPILYLRFVNLRRLKAEVVFLGLPSKRDGDEIQYWITLISAGTLGTYAAFEAAYGQAWIGLGGCIVATYAAVMSAWALMRED